MECRWRRAVGGRERFGSQDGGLEGVVRPLGLPALSGLAYTSLAESRRAGTSPNSWGMRSCTGLPSRNFTKSKACSTFLRWALTTRLRRLALLPV